MSKFGTTNRKASKLSIPEVQEIRALYKQGRHTQGMLCRQFGVSVVQIGRIVRGEVWQQLPVFDHLMSEGELKESAARVFARHSPGMAALQEEAQKTMGPATDMLDELIKGDEK